MALTIIASAFFSQFISLLIISLLLFEKAIIFSCLLFKKNYDGAKSFRYVLYNLGKHALIYEARLIDFHEYAYLHDVIQCLKALLYWIKIKKPFFINCFRKEYEKYVFISLLISFNLMLCSCKKI